MRSGSRRSPGDSRRPCRPGNWTGSPNVWDQYEALSRRSLGIGVIGLEQALAQQTGMLGDRVIANYRTALPSVRETQWRLAREALARAVSAAPSCATQSLAPVLRWTPAPDRRRGPQGAREDRRGAAGVHRRRHRVSRSRRAQAELAGPVSRTRSNVHLRAGGRRSRRRRARRRRSVSDIRPAIGRPRSLRTAIVPGPTRWRGRLERSPASRRNRNTSRGPRRRTGRRSTSTRKSSASPTSPARCG